MPRYTGSFGRAQAERLLWRAGFGPRPGQAGALARKGLRRAVLSLTRPPAETLSGPAPTDGKGHPLAPRDAWGHDHLWWLDRMIRSNQELVERMTLHWHDWFATRNGGLQRLMLDQNALLRSHALGSFQELLLGVTSDPAMLIFLSGTENTKGAPNENYARELMELFTLGAGRGYDEDDVREQARALTGWRNSWGDQGPYNFRFDPSYHDDGVKTIFGRSGRFDWQDACRLCLEHPRHPSFLVGKLWSYFIPTPPPVETRRELERLYRTRGYAVRPLLEAILMHPALYAPPRMVKPPIVHIAGMLRALRRGVDTDAWSWIADRCGQLLFYPPNVAGWDESRWLDTATWRGRWTAAAWAVKDRTVATEGYDPRERPETAVRRALRFWGGPGLGAETRDQLLGFARECQRLADQPWKQSSYRGLRQNALRLLIATCPDVQTC